jgi:hypothetical protein
MTRHDNSSWNYFYWEPFRDPFKGALTPADFGRLLPNRDADLLGPITHLWTDP